MTDWFDIFMRIIACIALFMAGYNIGWSRGFEKCRSSINEFAAQFVAGNKELNDLRKKVKELNEVHRKIKECEKNEEKG